MKVYLSGAPAHFISVFGRVKIARPPLSVKASIASQVRRACSGPA